MLRVDLLSYSDPHKGPEINIWFTFTPGDDAVEVHSLEKDLVLVDHIKKNGILGRLAKQFLLTDKEKFLEELRFEFSGSYIRASEIYEVSESQENEINQESSAIETIDDFSGEFLKNEKFCEDCKHLHSTEYTCDAFPEGIPTKYLTGREEHTSSRGQDNDVVWEYDKEQKFDKRLQKMLENSQHVVVECHEDYEKAKREEKKLEKLGYSVHIHTEDTWPPTYTVHGVK